MITQILIVFYSQLVKSIIMIFWFLLNFLVSWLNAGNPWMSTHSTMKITSHGSIRLLLCLKKLWTFPKRWLILFELEASFSSDLYLEWICQSDQEYEGFIFASSWWKFDQGCALRLELFQLFPTWQIMLRLCWIFTVTFVTDSKCPRWGWSSDTARFLKWKP